MLDANIRTRVENDKHFLHKENWHALDSIGPYHRSNECVEGNLTEAY